MFIYKVAKYKIWHFQQKNKSKIFIFGLVPIRNVSLVNCPTFLILNVVQHKKPIMKKLILVFFFFLTSLSYSQDWNFEKPNYNKIEKNIKIKNSNLFYESLLDRFQNADSTMTLEEKRHLYYLSLIHI